MSSRRHNRIIEDSGDNLLPLKTTMEAKKLTKSLASLFLLVLTLGFALAITETGTDTGTIGVGSGGAVIPPEDNSSCGNGILEPYYGEQCDGSNLGGASCSSLFSGYTGTLTCSSNCIYNSNNCQASNNGGETSGGGGGGGGGSDSGFVTTGLITDCAENWACFDWGICSNGIQTRSCDDLSNCNTNDLKPTTERSCSVEGAKGDAGIGLGGNNESTSSSGFFSGITGAVIGGLSSPKVVVPLIFGILLAGAAIFVVAKRRKKDSSPEIN